MKVPASKHKVAMLHFLIEIIFMLGLVSPSTIPNRRNVLLDRIQPVNQQESQLKVRRVSGTESYKVKRETRQHNSWEKICQTETEIVPLIPAIDDGGNRIFRLAVAGSVDYQEFVKVERCRDVAAHVGGVTVQCEQEYLEHTLVVFDSNTGQEKVKRPFFYPSGCSAKILKPR
eukprot:GFUD01072799.1.p1 GENE.GFUD01072799.1~~GFUD01072799.1.p1  ORF type:complete len:173 (-),score=16.71 GFUD01072799.1:179-697(-)